MKTIRIAIIALLVVGAAVGVTLLWWNRSPEVSRERLHEARVAQIRSMVELCALEFHDEVPVKGDIGTRHLVARQVLEGSVSFDLESLDLSYRGDTLVVLLPPEKVTVMESTLPDSYVVIDAWNDDIFGSSNFTVAEENSIKERAARAVVARVYTRGYVRRARAEAVASLSSMLMALSGCPVEVIDPSPEGYALENASRH